MICMLRVEIDTDRKKENLSKENRYHLSTVYAIIVLW